jgi:hypothetical protein
VKLDVAKQKTRSDLPSETYLFGRPDELLAEISTNIPKDTRSLRRGGLTMMALAGASVQQVLQFSRHATEKMLMKYLEHGAVLRHAAEDNTKTFHMVNTMVPGMY